jgi:indolepyruvate ferredoxin oxidoreductase alpha subunit
MAATPQCCCPSFYRAEVVHHPTGFERWRDRLRRRIVAWLQARRERRRLIFAPIADG